MDREPARRTADGWGDSHERSPCCMTQLSSMSRPACRPVPPIFRPANQALPGYQVFQGRFIFPRSGGLSLLPLGEGAAKRRMRANRPGPGRPSPGLRPDPASGVPPAPRGCGFESPNPAKMKRPCQVFPEFLAACFHGRCQVSCLTPGEFLFFFSFARTRRRDTMSIGLTPGHRGRRVGTWGASNRLLAGSQIQQTDRARCPVASRSREPDWNP